MNYLLGKINRKAWQAWLWLLGWLLGLLGFGMLFVACAMYGPAVMYGPPPVMYRRVAGIVTGPDGQPVAALRVSLTDAAGRELCPLRATGPDGSYELVFSSQAVSSAILHIEDIDGAAHGRYASQQVLLEIGNDNYGQPERETGRAAVTAEPCRMPRSRQPRDARSRSASDSDCPFFTRRAKPGRSCIG